MNRRAKATDFAPLLLMAGAILFGVGAAHSSARLWFRLCTLAVLCGGLTLHHLGWRKTGLALLAVALTAYVALGAALDWSRPLDWAFYLLGTLASALALGGIRRGATRLRRERDYERQLRGELVDESAELRNLRSYQNDGMIYLRIARRHGLYVGLALWRLQNADELRRRMGEKEFAQLVRDVSRTLRGQLRYEDMIFLLDDTQVIWGTMHIANNPAVCEIVVNRLMGRLEALQVPEGLRPRFDTCAVLADNAAEVTPMGLLDEARRRIHAQPTTEDKEAPNQRL
ncbi:MAG: hypothetical protein PHY12_12530 [Eubacteriales bacterium]|nr:hypothetical protein [Eubacteriales bacterium]